MRNPLQSLRSMWMHAAPPAPAPIGLELGSERVHLVQFADDGTGRVLRAAASLPLPLPREALLADAGALKALVHDALRTHGFKGRRVVSCLPSPQLRIFPVSVTVGEGADEAAAFSAELRARLGAEIDDAVVDYLPVRGDDAEPRRRDALVALARRDAVMAYLTALERAGLEVAALDIGPAALARLVAHVNGEDADTPHPNVLAINFGRQRSYLSVIWGRRLLLDREIEFAESTLLARVSGALGVDEAMARQLLTHKGLPDGTQPAGADAEISRTLAEVLRPEFGALVAEVNKTLIYIASRSRGRSVDRVYVLGSVGRYPGADRLLQGLLSIPVSVLDPFERFRSLVSAAELGRLEPVAGIALACGLALRGVAAHA
jgi:type IV pilus assembly protein PilM